jgi:hypothetical protein
VTRVEWSRDGALVLVCTRWLARVLAPDGSPQFSIEDVLDARWAPNGVVSIDGLARVRVHLGRPPGRLVETRDNPSLAANTASLAAGGWRYALRNVAWTVHSARGVELWRHERYRDANEMAGIRATLSDDGRRIALAYRDRTGCGWIVYDVETGAVVDRARADGTGTVALAFDAPGDRLAVAMPDGATTVVRLGAQAVDPHTRWSEPAAVVALDPRGALAAYGYARAPIGARGRLRVDDLTGGDTLWLEVGLPDIAALAFDHGSRWIACAAQDGALEVVPVP